MSIRGEASPPEKHFTSRNDDRESKTPSSFSGNERSTPSSVPDDDVIFKAKQVYSHDIDSPTSSYFKTSPDLDNSPISRKEKLNFKIKLLRMKD